MNILSIQSHVAFGHVGNSAAVFPLQRLGIDVWPVHTVQLSNHTGYGSARGGVFGADRVAEVVLGLEERGILAGCDGVLSGYVGDGDTVAAVAGAVARVRGANPEALYLCDPVMGDIGRGLYIAPEVADQIGARLVPLADMATPNHFELEHLTGQTIRGLDDALAAAEALRRRGPDLVLVTSLTRDAAPADTMECLVVDGTGAWLVTTPRLPFARPPNGAGDALAALFLGHWVCSRHAADALERAVAALYSVLETTLKLGRRELALIAAQSVLCDPPHRFPASALPSRVG